MGITIQRSGSVRISEAENPSFDYTRNVRPEADGIKPSGASASALPMLGGDRFEKLDDSTPAAAAAPEELTALRADLQRRYGFHDILSKSPLMRVVFQMIKDLADANATVIIEGATGTGKEQVARAIHRAAAHRGGAFVAVNCAALSESLLETELFGHEKGAFTGAAAQRRGRFELAQGGVIFLDEVGDMPPSMQVKLLRVLQERCFERVGGTETIQLNVRVIGATNRSLRDLVREGKFREDLFYRLNVVAIKLPLLSQRPEDIPLLAAHFIEKHARPGEFATRIAPLALDVLSQSSWPGNIRQLENAIERACVTSRGQMIDVEDLPPELNAAATPSWSIPIDLKKPLAKQVREAIAQIECQFLRKALLKTRGHIGKCARICGLSRRSVTSKMTKYRLDRFEFYED